MTLLVTPEQLAHVWAAYDTLLAGYHGTDPETARTDVHRAIVMMLGRQEFSDPVHLASLDAYGMVVAVDVDPVALAQAREHLAPLTAMARPGVGWGELAGAIHEELTDAIVVEVDGRLVRREDAARRKRGGVYYTPIELIDALLDSTLEPLLDRAVGGYRPEEHRDGCLCPPCLDRRAEAREEAAS